MTYSRVIANWFDRKRGLALGLASTGIGLGAFITPSLAQFLMDETGWGKAYLGLAEMPGDCSTDGAIAHLPLLTDRGVFRRRL